MLLQLVLRQHQLWRCHQPREPWARVSGQTCSLCPGPHTCSLHQKYRVCTVLDTGRAAREPERGQPWAALTPAAARSHQHWLQNQHWVPATGATPCTACLGQGKGPINRTKGILPPSCHSTHEQTCD